MPNSSGKRPEGCRATTSKGKQCRSYAIAGSEYCFFHDPAHAPARAAARRRGGKQRSRSSGPTPFPETEMTSTAGLASFLAQLIRETWTLKPSFARARTLAYLVKLQNELNQRVEREESDADFAARWRSLGPLFPELVKNDPVRSSTSLEEDD
jgi:hypothetical protein